MKFKSITTSNVFGFLPSIMIVFLLFCSHTKVKATHIVGGVMTYECLANNDYRINLTVYRDCNGAGAPFDQFAPIGIFDVNGNLINLLSAPFPGSTPVPIILNNPCLISPPNVCVERADYQINVTLPPIVGGYTIVYQRCCRNGNALNIPAPSTMGSTYMVKIPDTTTVTCNSSPIFNNPPPVMMCNGFEFTYDLSATDVDGDSLVYEFGDPINGGDQVNPAPNPPSAPPYLAIPWNTGFGTTSQIPSNPTFSINAQTGFLSGTPTTNGFYTFAIKIKEYRNGVFLGDVVRDFLLIVTTCATNTVSAISPQTTFCSGLTLNFFENTTNASSFYWDFGVVNAVNDTSLAQNPVFTFPDTGTYTVMLVANPGYFCADTSYQTFVVKDDIDVSFLPKNEQCRLNNSFDFEAIGIFSPNATFLWNFGSAAIPQTSNSIVQNGVTYNGIGTFLASITVQDFGCTETYTDSITIIPSPTAEIIPQSIFCNGLTVNFTNNSSSATNYLWNFGDTTIFSDTSIQFSPAYTYNDSGTYNVMLIAKQGNVCADTTFSAFRVYPTLDVFVADQQGQCLPTNLFNLSAQGNFNDKAIINWNFDALATPSSTLGNNVTVSYPAIGFYPYSVTVQNFGCEDTFFDTLGVYPVPVPKFTAQAEIGCQPFSVQFYDSSLAATPLQYFWQFGDGGFSSAASPSHTYLFPGLFDVKLTIITDTGCIDTNTFLLTDLITVHPKPNANFEVNPVKLSILNPDITIKDLSNEVVVEFNLDDGSVFSAPSFSYTYQDTGHFKVQQIVYNEFGCSDTLIKQVWVHSEFLLFVPTAFTPNDDDLNDVFLPIISGAKEYEFSIFNRWGEEFFKTKNQEIGWDGTINGVPVQIGTYTWRIVAISDIFQRHEKTGVVNLIR